MLRWDLLHRALNNTDLKKARRLAAQALVEEALEFGIPRGYSRVEIEEMLGLHGNPLGQTLGEYIRGEIAPSLARLQSVENRLADFVKRAPRKIQVAMPSWFQGRKASYEHSTNEEWGYHSTRREISAAAGSLAKVLADAAAGVTSRALLKEIRKDVIFPMAVEVIADGLPLMPIAEPLAARAKHLSSLARGPVSPGSAAGILPE